MNWEVCRKTFNIPSAYANVSIENVRKQSPKLAEFGKQWLESIIKPSIYLTGEAGCGKTYFLLSLLYELLMQSREPWILFTTSFDLDNELLQSQLSESEVIRKYSECPFVFWDDLGAERSNDRVARQYLAIINERTGNQLTTVFSSNYSMDGIKQSLGDRIASRLHLCTEIVFPKKDLRRSIVID
jgi:DNA replication protein DnaC